MSDATGLSALRIDGTETGHFYSTATMEPRVLERFVQLAERDGLLVPATGYDECYAVLDILDASGDIVDDRHVPTERAWNALNSELRLEVIAHE